MKREFDDVEDLLNRWAAWMHSSESIADGYPSKASGGFIPSWCKDTQEAADAADQREFESVNAGVDSLSLMQKRAVYRVHGVGYQVWQFGDLDGLYEQAKDSFRRIYFGRGK